MLLLHVVASSLKLHASLSEIYACSLDKFVYHYIYMSF